MSKINSIKIIIPGLIFLISIVFFSYFSYIKEGKTQSNIVDLKGWAWIGADCTNPNETFCGTQTLPIGWISFSSNNPEITCKNINYGVSVNTSTGEISGAALIGVGENDNYTDCNTTENTVGWLYFDSNQTPPCGQNGYPSDYCFPAKLVGNEIQGWAPIISKDDQGNQITIAWVRFKGSNYGVTFDATNQSLSGYAWSGWGRYGGLGWIYFLTAPPVSKALLIVQSLPITGISITANPSQFSGTTNYSVSSTNPISASLTAPMSFEGYNFERWEGCDSVSNNVCNVSVNLGEAKTVTAIYTTTITATTNFDLAVTSLDIRTFICKNTNYDLSYLNEYLSKNPNYMFAPSTTYAENFYNEVASSTCPESQRNRPVEFSATGTCLRGHCPASKLIIYIRPAYAFWPEHEREIEEFTTSYNPSYPKSIKEEYVFNKPYDYLVTACLVDEINQTINDSDNSNNCKEQTLRIFDYMCVLGFCTQNQRDIENPSPAFNFEPMMYKILKIFGDTDSPCRFYRNEICKARFGF
jgi:hypothetical protein